MQYYRLITRFIYECINPPDVFIIPPLSHYYHVIIDCIMQSYVLFQLYIFPLISMCNNIIYSVSFLIYNDIIQFRRKIFVNDL